MNVSTEAITQIANLDLLAKLFYALLMFLVKYIGPLVFFLFFHLLFGKLRPEEGFLPAFLIASPGIIVLLWITYNYVIIGNAPFGIMYAVFGFLGIIAGFLFPAKTGPRVESL